MPTLVEMWEEMHSASKLDHFVNHQSKDAVIVTRQNNRLEVDGGVQLTTELFALGAK